MNYSTLREKIYVVHKQNKQFFLTLFFWTNTEPGTDEKINIDRGRHLIYVGSEFT